MLNLNPTSLYIKAVCACIKPGAVSLEEQEGTENRLGGSPFLPVLAVSGHLKPATTGCDCLDLVDTDIRITQ